MQDVHSTNWKIVKKRCGRQKKSLAEGEKAGCGKVGAPKKKYSTLSQHATGTLSTV